MCVHLIVIRLIPCTQSEIMFASNCGEEISRVNSLASHMTDATGKVTSQSIVEGVVVAEREMVVVVVVVVVVMVVVVVVVVMVVVVVDLGTVVVVVVWDMVVQVLVDFFMNNKKY